MKFKSISLVNNPILGTTILDFCDGSGQPADTVIFAGENGSGKSTILHILESISSQITATIGVASSEKVTIVILLDQAERDKMITGLRQQGHIGFQPISDESPWLTIELNYSLAGNRNWSMISYMGSEGRVERFAGDTFSGLNGLFRTIYSDVETNFNPKAIQTITSEAIDSERFNSNSNDFATKIAQLIVDVQAQDDAEFARWGREHPGHVVDSDLIDRRMRRFKSAYEYMFPYMSYLGIKSEGWQRILFKQHGKEVELNSLSTGEKQIIFRGTFLLKDKQSILGRPILIDEPELSLHPSWQMRISDFYKMLFRDTQGKQTSQIFMATHSPFIIHNDSTVYDRIIVLKKNNNGNTICLQEATYPGWTRELAIKQAFNIEWGSTDKPIVYVEGETDEKYLTEVQACFSRIDVNADIRWIGRVSERGGTEFSGDTALTHTKNFLISNPGDLKCKVILMYDSDTKVQDQDIVLQDVKTVI